MRRIRPDGVRRVRLAGLALLAAVLMPAASRAQDELLQELKTVASVHLEGRHQLSGHAIRSVLKTRGPSFWPWRERPKLRFDYLRSDVASIAVLYRHYGFLDARAEYRVTSSRNSNQVEVTFLIDEGPRSVIRRVELAGVQAYPLRDLSRKLWARPGRPFDPAYLQLDTLRISELYQEKGYRPHVAAEAARASDTDVDVRYDVREGPQYRVGQVYLIRPDLPADSNAYRVEERLLRRELLLKPGETYRLSRVRRSQERLYESGLVSQVQVTPLPDSTNTLMEFQVQVRQRKPRWIDTGIGSGTDERFRFTGEWGHRNMAGKGLQGVVGSRLSLYPNGSFQRFHADASLLQPWLFGSRTRGQMTPYFERYDFHAEVGADTSKGTPAASWVIRQEFEGLDFQLRRELSRSTRVSLIQKNVFVNQDVSVRIGPSGTSDSLGRALADSVVRTVVSSYTTHRLALEGDRDVRDNPFDPTRGSVQSVITEIAGGLLQGSSSFTKSQIVSSRYTTNPAGWTLATRVRAGVINPFGKPRRFSPEANVDPAVTRVPLEDRFRTGGVNSIRGYNENAIPVAVEGTATTTSPGGLAVLQANLELRIPTGITVPFLGVLGLEVYLDAGNVWARPSYIDWSRFRPRISRQPLEERDVRYVVGIGPRIILPIGALRLDFTWSLRPAEGGPPYGRPKAQVAIGPSY